MVRRSGVWGLACLACLAFAQVITAIDVDWTSEDSIKSAASTVAYGLMTYYHGNTTGGTPGILPSPAYYWWEAGAMWGSLIDYWHYTGDASYNQVIMDGLQFQVGPYDDFMPPNQTLDMGNDDQAFWAFSAMMAAEYKFPNPPAGEPSWLSLVQAVFNEQVTRWDTIYCNGGLHWQVYRTEGGWPLKNTISNGGFFQIAARLARYTGDDMYAQWASKTWDWIERIGLVDENWNVWDNSESVVNNCSQVDHTPWTYNPATMLIGAATMYNYTNGDPIWEARVTGLLQTIITKYFPNGTMMEINCEQISNCNYDQKSFKAYLARWMMATTQMAPYTYTNISTVLLSTAKAAASQCIGSCGADPACLIPNGEVCGIKWYLTGQWDGTNGAGQQMTALAAIVGTLAKLNDPSQTPLTNSTGGTSQSNPTAGVNYTATGTLTLNPASQGEKGAAWFITVFMALMAVFMIAFLLSEAWETGESTVNGRRNRASQHFQKSGPGVIGGLAQWGLYGKGKEAKGKGAEADVAAPLPTAERIALGDRSHRLSKRTSSGLKSQKSRLGNVIVGGEENGEGTGESSEATAHGAIEEEVDRRKSIPIYRGGDLAT